MGALEKKIYYLQLPFTSSGSTRTGGLGFVLLVESDSEVLVGLGVSLTGVGVVVISSGVLVEEIEALGDLETSLLGAEPDVETLVMMRGVLVETSLCPVGS